MEKYVQKPDKRPDKAGRNQAIESTASLSRYQQLFNGSPVGILEEDYSETKRYIDSCNFASSDELAQHFRENPDTLLSLVKSVAITDVNPAALKAYRNDSEEQFIEEHYDYDDWLSVEWVDFFIEELVALYDLNLPFQRDFDDTAHDDSPIRIRNITRIVEGYEDDWSRIISIVEDITDRKKMEAQLHQAQKMEAIGQLTGGLAHDVNNILAIISGNAEILDEELEGENQQVMEIFHAISTGSSLVKQLLSFSRKQPLEQKVIQISDLVTNLTKLLGRTLGESIDISLKTASGLWVTETDPSQLENSLLNIVLNARDAMPDGGKLVIETSNEHIEHTQIHNDHAIPPGQYVVLSVIDNGTGMSQEQLSRVFEPFYTTKEMGAGSGLGLSSVYGFVKQTGGHIAMFSTEGMGTEVRIYLPKSSATEGILLNLPMESSPHAKGETILVLEDEKILSQLVSNMLKDLGYKVHVARNGLEALNILARTPDIDLLLSDIGLPGGMSGVAVAQKAANLNPELKFQFMSGYVEDMDKQYPELKKYGNVLDKPFRKSELAKRLRSVLENGKN